MRGVRHGGWKEGSRNLLLTQYICLSPDGRMAEFHTRIDWQERHRMLKVDSRRPSVRTM